MFRTGRLQDDRKENRIYWLDNLRTFMIFLVVLIHAAIVYEKNGMGAEWWIISDPSNNDLAGVLFLILNIFVMATVFFISGHLTPTSLKNKSAWEFFKTKFKRLILPWLITVLTLMPAYKVLFLHSRHLPQESWTTYFYWSSIWSHNWLWFLPVLFLFDMVYLCISRINVDLSRVSLKKAICAIFFISLLYSFCMDYFALHGWTKTFWINFQNERLLIYFLVFLLGSLCCKLETFESGWENKKLDIVLHCTGWIPINLYIFLLIYSLVNPGSYLISRVVDTLILRFNFLLSLAYLLYAMIVTFRKYLNRQGTLSRALNKNSYYVYLIHVIVLGVVALPMIGSGIPSWIKLFISTFATFCVSNLIIGSFRKVIPSNIFIHKMEGKIIKTAVTAVLLITLLTCPGYGKQTNSNGKNKAPRISLHTAALQGNIKAVQQHIRTGSDLNRKDGYGSTPLIVAITFGQTEVAKVLIDAGADMTITNNEKSTPLHIAAFFCRTQIVKALLDNRVCKDAKNLSGRTAFDITSCPFDEVKGIYDYFGKTLGPLGLKLNYNRIKKTRPEIADMLR